MCFYKIKEVSCRVVSTFREWIKVKRSGVFVPAHSVTGSVCFRKVDIRVRC